MQSACALVFCLMICHGLILRADILDGLVGRWDFDDGTGRDLSGHGADAVLGGTRIHPLGEGHACIEVVAGAAPLRIPATPDSPLSISHGVVCLWLNVAWEDSPAVLEYDNRAVQFRIYRRHFQPRFEGEEGFEYSTGILDYDWPKYDMREWAFYPHVRAAVGDSEWHHFAVAYDDQAKKIIGWRDGELISAVDLSTVAMKPLVRKGLKEIVAGNGFVGFIDDIRIYNRVLTDADMREIFNATKSVYEGRSDTIPIPTDRKKTVVYKYRKEDHSLYQAWLQYNPPSNRLGGDLLNRIVAEGANSTVQTAASELADAGQSMFDLKPTIEAMPVSGSKVVLGTPETSSWIRERLDKLALDRIKIDGFVIKSLKEGSDTSLVIAARLPAGVIFGTFDLIRRIQLGQDPRKLDVLENPKIPIRMVNHWSFFRGFKYDSWRKGGRDDSIFSWEDLRTGDTKLIRDWARMMSSAGWNAICPSEVNWDYRDNFLEHLDEVKTLAGILRNYGIKLYWSPSYLLALEKETADKLYARVPDFGGYMMKLGSEKQNGDPRPPMVNRIADHLKPHGGYALVRGFVYGNSRYAAQEYRNLIPYDIFASEDGKFRDNVVIIPKGSPLDWDFSAPIPAMDGAIQKNLSGSELVIDKDWPVSWIEKWKWWLEQDNYRKGPGSLNKFDVDCIMGVSMISPSPAWTECPLNMVNYYGLGRLSWNPDLSVDEIYTEWIRHTFGDDPEVINTIKTILLMSDDTTRKLYLYRGYRGIWISSKDTEDMVANKIPHTITPKGLGVASPELRKRMLDQYAPGLREIYGDPVRGEEFLPSFNFVSLDYRLSCGRTVCQDFYANLDEAMKMAGQMPELWSRLKGKVDDRRFQYTLDSLNRFIKTAKKQRDEMVKSFEAVTGRKYEETIAALAALKIAAEHAFNVRDFGAKADGKVNDAPAINKAIEKCNATGGGTVFIPAGIYAAGSIHLKSNVTLSLDAGAVLKALAGAMDPWEPNPNDRGLMDAAYYHWQASLIWGEDLTNVKILGPGTLDGAALTRSSKVPAGIGDKAIALKQCRGVEIRNLNIQQGGHYAILATGCQDMLLNNINIDTARDGLDLMQCRNVTVSNSQINAVRYVDGQPAGGDDAIKLGSDLSLGQVQPSENIAVSDCILASGCNTLQFGSETIGPFRNSRFENIRILLAGKAGIGITSNDGSVIDGVQCRNITMEKAFVPFFLKVSDVGRVPAGSYRRGSIRNVSFENITVTDCFSLTRKGEMPSMIWGKPGSPIENITFKNVRITAKGGHPVTEAALNPEENDARFPQDIAAIPAYAWYLRHVNKVHFVGCEFGFEKIDGRPALVIDDGKDVRLEACTLQQGSTALKQVDSRNASDVSIIQQQTVKR